MGRQPQTFALRHIAVVLLWPQHKICRVSQPQLSAVMLTDNT